MTSPRGCYFISAGEFSGDLLAADLVIELKKVFPSLDPFGIIGPAMRATGVLELVDQSQLSFMGIAEIAKHLSSIKILESFLLQRIDERQPDFAILVDYPGFHFRLAEKLKLRGIKVIQFVAPKLWAWGAGRARQLRENFDLVLGILPFEEDFFISRGINFKFVGNPLKERIARVGKRSKMDFGLSDKKIAIALCPGSRMIEIENILPRLLEIKQALAKSRPELEFIIPVAENLNIDDVRSFIGRDLDSFHLCHGHSLEIMRVCDVVVLASGTATLEGCLLGRPMVVVYVMNDFTFQIAKKAVKLAWVSLVNLIAGKKIVAEFIQYFDSIDVANEVLSLLSDQAKRQAMLSELEQVASTLKENATKNAALEIAALVQPRFG